MNTPTFTPVSSRPAPLFSIAICLVAVLLLLVAVALFAGGIYLYVSSR